MNFGYRSTTENYSFFGRGLHLFVYPRTLFAYICNLNHIGVQSRFLCRAAESRLMHTRRAGTYHNTGQFIIGNGIFYNVLPRLRTHVLIVGGKYNTGFVFQCLCNLLYIYRSCDICTAVTNKYTNFLHISTIP